MGNCAVALIHSSWISTRATRDQEYPITLQYASRGKATQQKGYLLLAFACSALKDLLLKSVGSNSSPSLHPCLQLRDEKRWGHAKIPGFAFGRFFISSVADVEPCA